MARCLKDKVGSGHYILVCSFMDRIGGKKIELKTSDCEEALSDLSRSFRDYTKNKRNFINKEHREMEKFTKDGSKVMVAAPKTGMNWFKMQGVTTT